MKIDLTKLPVGEAVIGFLMLAVIATFVVAFTIVDPLVDETASEPSPSATSGGETAAPGDLAIAMLDNSFDPSELTVVSGEEVSIAVHNEGVAIHNVRIAGLDGDYDTSDDIVSDPETIRGGQSGVIQWTPEAPGEQAFRCDFHPTEMTGTITIR